MLEWITQINNAVNGVVWGPAGLALLFGTGLIMSVRTGFFQFRKMGYWLRHTIGAIFTNKDITAHTSKEDMAISQFQSMCTALAGTIGTGHGHRLRRAGCHLLDVGHGVAGHDDQLFGERAGSVLPPQK